MCTLCLSDMGELRDDWLREPKKAATPTGVAVAVSAPPAPGLPVVLRPTAAMQAVAEGEAA